MNPDLENWLSGRPDVIKKLARKYPPGTRFKLHDKIMYVISYEESGGLSVTAVNPSLDHKRAVAERQPVCACCLKILDDLRIID